MRDKLEVILIGFILTLYYRSSVVFVLNSLTTTMEAPPLIYGYLIFAAPAPRALHASLGHNDLATAPFA